MQLFYAYAKTIGEKEAWRVAKESGIDLVVVNPSFVVGPLLAPQPTSTLLRILSIVKGQIPIANENEITHTDNLNIQLFVINNVGHKIYRASR